MATVASDFVVPYPLDRTVIAVQDLIDQLGWRVLEVSSNLFVVECPGLPGQTGWFPRLRISLSGTPEGTKVALVGSSVQIGSKRRLVGYMGQFTNSLSLRIQTNSVAINPTVSVGEGQGNSSSVAGEDRLSQLERLKALLESGILTEEEFRAEKLRILS